MFRRIQILIISATLLYLVAISIAWQQGSARAERRLEDMLTAAVDGFSAVINGEIEAALKNVGGAIINVLGRKCVPQPIERMQDLARTFNLDEINIVDRTGIAIGSNLKVVLGQDYNNHPLTHQFMSLTNSTTTMVSQPFRPGVANPDMLCKYYGLAFPDHDGFLQLGMTVTRLRQNMYTYTPEEADQILRDWHFSVVGWYARADNDPDFEEGKTVRRWIADRREMTAGKYFSYKGYRYLALMPESYCYAQRNSFFLVTALVLAVLVVIFTYFLVRLTTASAKLEALHTAANARTAADLATARKIQMAALPSADGAFMERLEFSLSAECHPAREVGGDFYDFFHLSSGRLVFLVADVSGKGIPGALFMMEAKNVLKNCLVEFSDITEAVAEANERLCANNKAELFVTAWIGVLDKDGTFEYVNAGHNRPFVRRVDGTVEKVMGKGGHFLGMFNGASYRANVLKLQKGDMLYLYTDGITEAMNRRGELFGEKRLCAVLAAQENVKDRVWEFVGGAEQSDDATGMAICWHGRPKRAERAFPCTVDSLGSVVDFIRSELAGLDRKTITALLNSSDEITSNIVNYSGSKEFVVAVECAKDRLRLTFSDGGVAYNPILHIDPDTHAAIEDRPIGGLGLVIVKRLADRVTYTRENGRNVLTILKKIERSS